MRRQDTGEQVREVRGAILAGGGWVWPENVRTRTELSEKSTQNLGKPFGLPANLSRLYSGVLSLSVTSASVLRGSGRN